MACIIKGQSIACTQKSRDHYMRGKENEKITVCEVSGFATQNADEALSILEVSAKGTKCKKPVYSTKINPETDRIWTEDEWQQAIDLLEKNLALTGHPRVVVEHTKNGRIHRHVLWSRYHPDGGAAKNMGNDYAAHQKTQKEIGQAFQLRPMMAKGREFKHWEVEWAKRYGFDIFKLRDQITTDFNGDKSGQAFKEQLESKGIVLCRGDKSQFVLILPWGQHKALSSMIMGRPTKAILRRALGDIDITKLPTVAEGKAQVTAVLPKLAPKPRSAKGKGRSGKSAASAHTYIRRGKGDSVTAKKGTTATKRRGAALTRSWQRDGAFVTTPRIGSVLSKPMQPLSGTEIGKIKPNTPTTASTSTNNTNKINTSVPPNDSTKQSANNKISATQPPPPTTGALHHGHIASGGHAAPPPVPTISQSLKLLFSAAKEEIANKQQSMPLRPASYGSMCLEQIADLEAAIAGKMTWAEYSRKWGRGNAPTM